MRGGFKLVGILLLAEIRLTIWCWQFIPWFAGVWDTSQVVVWDFWTINSSICEYKEQPFHHKMDFVDSPTRMALWHHRSCADVFRGELEDLKLAGIRCQLSSDQNPDIPWNTWLVNDGILLVVYYSIKFWLVNKLSLKLKLGSIFPTIPFISQPTGGFDSDIAWLTYHTPYVPYTGGGIIGASTLQLFGPCVWLQPGFWSLPTGFCVNKLPKVKKAACPWAFIWHHQRQPGCWNWRGLG